jgi:hypothetical protein
LEPSAAIAFPDAGLLAGQHGRDVNALAMRAEAAAGGDRQLAIVEWIDQLGQAIVASCCANLSPKA